MLEHGLAMIGGQPRHRLRRLDRALDARVDRRRIRLRDPEGDLARIFVGDLEVGVRLLRLVVEVERINLPKLHHHSAPLAAA